jgi:DNA-binding transcriptional regulator YiaG
MADMVDHGTSPKGERNGSSRLSEDQVREIRSLRGRVSQRKIAQTFGIAQMTVSDIQRRKSWPWLD